jgi:phosphate transport system protein
VIYREIEERCIHTIALHQPVAGDLRFISTTMNVASNLERIGDYSKDIAMIVPFIVNEPVSGDEENVLWEMGKIARKMTKDSIDAFINKDLDKVDEVNACEETIDALYCSVFLKLKEMLRTNSERVPLALNLLLVARYLERIGDHSVNIANRTMYAVKGKGKYL